MKVVMSTYLTSKGDPQGKQDVPPNQNLLVDNWYLGIEHGVIFHDELSDNFRKQYPKVEFVKSAHFKYSANDSRFYMFRSYLAAHPEIDVVFMTDLFDVVINKIPDPDDRFFLYISTEEDKWQENSWCKKMFKFAANKDEIDENMLGKPIFNPGVWGGRRENVLKALNYVIDQLERLNIDRFNCNMLAFNRAVYNQLGEETIFTGYPLHSRFKKYEVGSKAWFIHK